MRVRKKEHDESFQKKLKIFERHGILEMKSQTAIHCLWTIDGFFSYIYTVFCILWSISSTDTSASASVDADYISQISGTPAVLPRDLQTQFSFSICVSQTNRIYLRDPEDLL